MKNKVVDMHEYDLDGNTFHDHKLYLRKKKIS